MMLSRFSYAYWLPACLLFVKCLFNYFVHFLLDYLYFYVWYEGMLYIFWTQILCWIRMVNIFSKSAFFFLKQCFNFDETQLLSPPPPHTLMISAFFVLSQRSLPVPHLLVYSIVSFQELCNFSFKLRKMVHLKLII